VVQELQLTDLDMTISEVKCLIEKATLIPADEQHLFLEVASSDQLCGHQTCAECGVEQGCELTLMQTWSLFIREMVPDGEGNKAVEMHNLEASPYQCLSRTRDLAASWKSDCSPSAVSGRREALENLHPENQGVSRHHRTVAHSERCRRGRSPYRRLSHHCCGVCCARRWRSWLARRWASRC
jgi:hypothetical protein